MVAIRFLLNGEWRSEDRVPASTTVLDWLRGTARLTGTKEGCAEGDCGACTIAVARPRRGALRYEAVNSCLMLVPQLDGCAVTTVEGLAGPDGALHPVQAALVEADATQCGFCTPGFAMAMFAYAQGGEPAEEPIIHEALAGNLCRCTGYRPIVEACRKIAGLPDSAAQIAPDLQGVQAGMDYRCGDQAYFAPRSLAEIADLRAQYPDAVVLAGGTDLGLLASKERKSFPVTISTAQVAELQRVLVGRDGIEIGAAVTYTEALPHIEQHYPAFGEIIRRIGSRQIRNLGTIAGNIANASPIGDTIPCLMALEASVTLYAKAGSRSMPVEDFIIGYRKTALAPGEVIASVHIPLPRPSQQFVAYKLSKRFDQDISTVIAAFSLSLAGGGVKALRAAFGGMAAKSGRAKHVEAAVTGKPWNAESLKDIDALMAKDFSPMSDQRGTASYRLRAAANLVRRLQFETGDQSAPARVEAL
ncbi:MAG: xanthine dehydrogenase small subunit [Pseudorhodoplanes sp.]|nr:xanthine dehydrogenase small subunit [Pseudorhodoplanes sp.]